MLRITKLLQKHSLIYIFSTASSQTEAVSLKFRDGPYATTSSLLKVIQECKYNYAFGDPLTLITNHQMVYPLTGAMWPLFLWLTICPCNTRNSLTSQWPLHDHYRVLLTYYVFYILRLQNFQTLYLLNVFESFFWGEEGGESSIFSSSFKFSAWPKPNFSFI